jgi:hypothetical protein
MLRAELEVVAVRSSVFSKMNVVARARRGSDSLRMNREARVIAE